MDDEDGYDRVYTTNKRPFQSPVEHRKAIEYHEKRLKTAMKAGDRAGEGGAYGNVGVAYHSLGDHEKSIEYYEKHLQKIGRASCRERV